MAKSEKKKSEKAKTEKKMAKTVGTLKKEVSKCEDRDCPFHGKLKARGRIFKGHVVRKFPRRITIEFERMVYFRKFERYAKMKTKIHARLPDCMTKEIEEGDLIKIQECRPLSKIIHFVVIEKLDSKAKIKVKETKK